MTGLFTYGGVSMEISRACGAILLCASTELLAVQAQSTANAYTFCKKISDSTQHMRSTE